MLLSGMDMTAAAFASGLVPEGTSPAVAKKTALQALGDSDVKAFMIGVFEEANLTPLHFAETIKRNLTTKNYALHQATGRRVKLGDDGMTQIAAAKLGLQVMGALGGSAAKPVDQAPPPPVIQVNYYGDDKSMNDDDVIDGTGSYTVRD